MEVRAVSKSRKHAQLAEFWRRFRKNKTAVLGLVILIIILSMALFADLIVPYSKCIDQVGADRLQGSSMAHFFGTDELGRDLFARVVHGSRYSLLIGLATSLMALVIGAVLGASAGYFGGWVDNVISRIVDVFMCVPPILLSLAVVAALGTNLRNLIIAITVSCVPGNVRLIRSVVLTAAEQDYVEAAKSYGASNARIIFRYVLPNAMGPIIVNTTMSISDMMLSAAGLSFIGMGIQPPSPEWGALLSNAQIYLFSAPHMLLFPGLCILFSSLAFNLVGDGLTDALDPKLKD
ncbi:MAG TPA: ABC transporter permease [Candidatus Merdiplasma excrementigallinarum]|uniref:ABC transporter permease n=1 Tax=Candidatus Merdiplasma excrementigallinarum TaxID=2840864 RepID=A0A9D1NZL5_9FIRM|nr:ABC transporter permease [Candidatus Merdiplasma excrementigallinarum]